MSTTEKLEAKLALVTAQRKMLAEVIALLIPLHDATGNTGLADKARAAIAIEASTEFQPVVPPVLDIDGILYAGRLLPANAKLERRIVANLLAWLEFNGWKVNTIDDGEEESSVADAKAAMELIFNLDEARVEVGNADGIGHRILLTLGEGVDVISDWGFGKGDPDGFNAVMDGFNAEDYE